MFISSFFLFLVYFIFSKQKGGANLITPSRSAYVNSPCK